MGCCQPRLKPSEEYSRLDGAGKEVATPTAAMLDGMSATDYGSLSGGEQADKGVESKESPGSGLTVNVNDTSGGPVDTPKTTTSKRGDAPTPSPGPQRPPSTLLQMPNVRTMSAADAAAAFATTENVYVKEGLKVLTKDFIAGLKSQPYPDIKKILQMEELVSTRFEQNLGAIEEFNTKLEAELRVLRESDKLLPELGKTMLRFIPFFKMYAAYIMNYRAVSKFFKDQLASNKRLSQFIVATERSTGVPFDTLLSAPASRLPQYLVLLGAIHAQTPESAAYREELAKATTAIKAVTDDISVTLRDKSARDLVVAAQTEWFRNTVEIISPHRLVVKHGVLKQVEESGKVGTVLHKYLFVLCNDILLYGIKATLTNLLMGGGSVKGVTRLKGASLRQIPETSSMEYKNAFVVMFDKQPIPGSNDSLPARKPLVLCAPSADERNNWMKALQTIIDDSKDKRISPDLDDDNFEKMVMKKAFDKGFRPKKKQLEPEVSKRSPWKRFRDDSTGDFYYENVETLETTWERPADFVEEKSLRGPPPRSGKKGDPLSPSSANTPSSPNSGGSTSPRQPHIHTSPVHASPASPAVASSSSSSSRQHAEPTSPSPSSPRSPTRVPFIADAAPATPDAPQAPDAPDAPDAPEAPAAPDAPPDAPDAPAADSAKPFSLKPSSKQSKSSAPASTASSLGSPSNMLDQLKTGIQLKSATDRQLAQPAKEPAKGYSLQDALKASLDQYRKFVQDEDDEAHAKGAAEEDWD